MENQAYISHVHLKGYKSIRDMSVDLLPGLNIIIGPNGSGKTSFLEFLEYSDSFSIFQKNHPKQDFYSHIEAFDYKKDKIDSFYKGTYKLKSKKIPQYVIQIREEINNEIVYSDGEFVFSNNQEHPEFINNLHVERDKSTEIGTPNYITFINPLHFLLNQGIKINIVEVISEIDLDSGITGDTYPVLFIEGPHNLDGVEKLLEESFNSFNEKIGYKSLKQGFDIHEKFKNTLSLFTSIKDIKLDFDIAREFDARSLDNLFFQFHVNNKWLYWSQLSDGTKRLFYILVNVFFNDRNTPVLIEEPELGIHPDQLHLLMDFLKEQSKEKQIIITTHSPEVLNILGKDELDRIIITRYDDEKGTQMHHLSPKQIRKGQIYIEEVGNLKSFWVHSNLEEYEAE